MRWCPHCHSSFQPAPKERNPKKYCSDKCRKAASRLRNAWRYRDTCPSCGGLKMKVAKRCIHCAGTNNPDGINGR